MQHSRRAALLSSPDFLWLTSQGLCIDALNKSILHLCSPSGPNSSAQVGILKSLCSHFRGGSRWWGALKRIRVTFVQATFKSSIITSYESRSNESPALNLVFRRGRRALVCTLAFGSGAIRR